MGTPDKDKPVVDPNPAARRDAAGVGTPPSPPPAPDAGEVRAAQTEPLDPLEPGGIAE